MKINVLIICLLFNFLGIMANAAPGMAISTTNRTTVIQGENMLEGDFAGAIINPGGTLSINLSEIASWDSIDFKITTCSTGAITTGLVTWKQGNRAGTFVSSENITAGTDITDFDSGWFTLTLTNPSGSVTANVTGNVLITND